MASTSDKLQVVTGSTGTIDVHASWIDLASGVVTAGRTNSNITGATTTDVVTSPAASASRNIKTLHIANNHATTSNVVTIRHTDGTNVVPLETVTLLAGERIGYIEGQGFNLVDANGSIKTAAGMAGVFTQRLGTTQSNSTTTATEVTGLSMASTVGTWIFEYFLRFQSATATVGPKLSVNHDGTVTTFFYTVQHLQVNTADSLGAMDQDATTTQVMGGMAARAKSTAGGLIHTVGVDTTAADVLIMISGLAIVTVAGNFELWHGSETATSTSIMDNSVLRLTKAG